GGRGAGGGLGHGRAGLRGVRIAAGRQGAAGESARSLDAVSVAEAESLQRLLLRAAAPDAKDAPDTEVPADAGAATEAEAPAGAETGADGPAEVYARFQPGWFVYNMFNVWAYVFAIGVGWGAYWLLTGFGVDVGGFVAGLV